MCAYVYEVMCVCMYICVYCIRICSCLCTCICACTWRRAMTAMATKNGAGRGAGGKGAREMSTQCFSGARGNRLASRSPCERGNGRRDLLDLARRSAAEGGEQPGDQHLDGGLRRQDGGTHKSGFGFTARARANAGWIPPRVSSGRAPCARIEIFPRTGFSM